MARISLVFPAMAGLVLSVSMIALAAEGRSRAGAYGGLHVGHGIGDNHNIKTTGQAAGNIANVASGACPGSVSNDADGFIGGVALGYNKQSSNIVYGLETDIDLTDINDTSHVGTVNPTVTPPPSLTNNFKQDLQYLGTVRARLGGVKNKASFTGAAPTSVGQFSGSNDDTEYGWVLGAGVEHALDAHLRMTASCMYYDLGSNTIGLAVVSGSGGGGTGYISKFDTTGHLLRAGIGYQF